MGEYALGQAVPRSEDPRLLSGGGRYVDDVQLPRTARAWILRSPFAHATIKSIDTSAAEAAPGVLLVLTGKDWEASGWGDLPVASGRKRRGGLVHSLSRCCAGMDSHPSSSRSGPRPWVLAMRRALAGPR